MSTPRRPNFMKDELKALTDGIHQRQKLLFSSFNNTDTHLAKERGRQQIVEEVNAVSQVKRSKEEIKRKWTYIKSETKKNNSQHKRSLNKTGGGPVDLSNDPDETERVVLGILGPTAINGISGGIETTDLPNVNERGGGESTSSRRVSVIKIGPPSCRFKIKLMVMTRRKSNLNLCRRKRSRIQPEVDQPTISPTKSPSVKKLKQCKSSFLIKIKSPAKNIKFHPISTTEEISTKSPVDLSKGHDRGLTGPCIRLFADQLQNDMLHEIEHEIEDPPKNDKLQELIALAPAVLTVLNQNNCADSIVKFFKVVSEGKFPLDNIAFLLWIELVNFFSTSNTCEMRYMDSTKKFWKLGWILFGSKFVRFMMGFKNTSQITFGETVQGSFNPTEADINFAVPDIKVLRNFQPYNSTKNNIREPGIFTDIMHDIANSLQDTSACLSFDGKKLKQGLSGTHGDINLLGFEDGVSLYEKQKKLEAELSMVYEIIGEIQVNVKMVGLNDIPQAMKADIVSVLQEVLKLLGLTAKSLRKIKEKKLYAKAKFIERSAPGSDWKNGQYVYVISSINAFLYEIDSFFWHYDITLEKLLSVLSSLNGCSSMYIGGYHFKLDDHQNFKPLADIETDDTRLVKQRSSKWFKIRQTAKVTGSSIYAALGLGGLKKMQDHFDQVVCHVPPKERSAEVQSFLDYGTNHEIYAVATLVGKILPSLYPGLVYYEEGCIAIQYEEQNFMVVSPDGSLRSENGTNDICGIEIKCPVKQMHNEVPVRYLLQCMCEMEVLQVDKLLYICWMPDITSVFEIRRNDDLFLKVLDILLSIYGNEKPKRPTKLPEGIGQLRTEVQIDCQKAIFCGEFPSISNIDNECVNTTEATKTDSLEVLQQVAELIKDGYELKRERASEAMVFLCCDLDRNWSKDQIRWAPVCWFPKGYSLTTNVFRNIVENVHNQCHTAGVHIPCSSFDGQWHNLAVRDKDGKPLTMLQLQKDVWQENCKLQKSEIIKWLCAHNCTVKLSKSENGAIFLTNGGTSLPILSKRALQNRIEKKRNENQQSKEDDNQIIPQSECIPEQIIRAQMDTIDEGQNEVLAHLTLDSEAAHELESCNTANTVLVEDSDEAECADDISQTITNLFTPNITGETGSRSISTTEDDIATYSYKLTFQDAESILCSLKSDKQANAKGIWDTRDCEFILTATKESEKMENLRDCDIKIFLKFFKHKKLTNAKLSIGKDEKLKAIFDVIGLVTSIQKSHMIKKKAKLYNVKSLKDQAKLVLSGKEVSKHALNIMCAEYVWQDKLSDWKDSSRLKHDLKVSTSNFPEYWFYIPDYSKEREQLEVRCVDSSHLLTRTRRKVCKGGIEHMTNEPWVKVARSKKTLITPIMIEDIVDPMSVPMAVTHFCSDVENTMRNNGDMDAASFCHAVRSWWKAEDESGISALDRIHMRIALRERLLDNVNFGRFPPPTMYIKGWPLQLWEALVANIDSKAILYSLAKRGTYNVRAFSSMMGETFFAEVTNQDKGGTKGTVTAAEFSHFIGKSLEQMHIRLDTERTFTYRTSRSSVYNLVENDHADETYVGDELQTRQQSKDVIHVIKPRDHFFDTKARTRASGKQRLGTVSLRRNAVQKGTLGVRWEKARVNESKLLPTRKMGIPNE